MYGLTIYYWSGINQTGRRGLHTFDLPRLIYDKTAKRGIYKFGELINDYLKSIYPKVFKQSGVDWLVSRGVDFIYVAVDSIRVQLV